ncbi:unnamed protein product, partial [Rotaria sordida]
MDIDDHETKPTKVAIKNVRWPAITNIERPPRLELPFTVIDDELDICL